MGLDEQVGQSGVDLVVELVQLVVRTTGQAEHDGRLVVGDDDDGARSLGRLALNQKGALSAEPVPNLTLAKSFFYWRLPPGGWPRGQ